MYCQWNRRQTESWTGKKCRTSDIHGQALLILSVYDVATSVVALHWICDSPRMGCAWRTTLSIRGLNKHNSVISSGELILSCCLLIAATVRRFAQIKCCSGFSDRNNVNGPNAYEIAFFMITTWQWDCDTISGILWSWVRHSLLYASIFMVCTLHFWMHFSLFFTISKLITSEDFSANFVDALHQILLTGQAAKWII